MKEIRIGTRESLLAVAQAEMVKQFIELRHPGIAVSLVKIKTSGDKILGRKLDEIGGKGLFVKELDDALLQGRTDLSVHSLKDMPIGPLGASGIMEDYPVLGYSCRETPEDALVLPKGHIGLAFQGPIGTSSPRRCLQLAQVYPGHRTAPVRGNVMTRLEKLDKGEFGALVLAAAGLKRLGLLHRISRLFPVSQMLPAPGQGILAIQGRKDFDVRLLAGFFDEDAKWQALAERSFVQAAGGGCASPLAAYAAVDGESMLLTALLPDGRAGMRKEAVRGLKQEAVQLGRRLFDIAAAGNGDG